MPVLNEETHLRDAVDGILAQDYAGTVEIVLALGQSKDHTNDVAAAMLAEGLPIVSVDNPSGRTASGLNLAIEKAQHDIIVRVDGHAMLPRDYVRTAVETLERTGADNVGGIMHAQGVSAFERAVARAMTHKLGVGSAAFHVGGAEGPAETVYLGTFRRAALERVGCYDDRFVRAQDWELNLRIRATGGLIWFNPAMRVTYRPRSTPRALARQYFEYGRWRRELVRLNPTTLNLRYLAPPLAVVLVCLGLFGTIVALVVGTPQFLVLAGLLPLAGYAGLIAVGALTIGRGGGWRSRWTFFMVIVTMHASWGAGFLTSPRRLSQGDGPV